MSCMRGSLKIVTDVIIIDVNRKIVQSQPYLHVISCVLANGKYFSLSAAQFSVHTDAIFSDKLLNI